MERAENFYCEVAKNSADIKSEVKLIIYLICSEHYRFDWKLQDLTMQWKILPQNEGNTRTCPNQGTLKKCKKSSQLIFGKSPFWVKLCILWSPLEERC